MSDYTKSWTFSKVDGQALPASDIEAIETELSAVAVATNSKADSTELVDLSGITDAVTALTNVGVTATAAEVNKLDGLGASAAELDIMDGSATVQATVTLAGTDGVVISDGDVMKQCLVSDFDTYSASTTKTLSNKTLAAPVVTGNVAFDTDTLYVDATNDAVGVGTTTPYSYSFQIGSILVAGNVADAFAINSVLTSPTGVGYLAFADGSTGTERYAGLIQYAHTTDKMSFRTASTDKVTIDSAGNVAVDTDTLYVDATNNAVGVGNAAPSGHAVSSGNVLTVGNVADAFASLSIATLTTGKGYLAFSDGTTGSEKYVGLIQYDHATNEMAIWTAGVGRVTIDSAGNVAVDTDTLYADATNDRVGVNTATPAVALDVVGDVTSTGTITYGTLSDGTIGVTAFADEDDMSSNSATLVPTQQSVKAYVDTSSAATWTLKRTVDTPVTAAANDALIIDPNTNTVEVDLPAGSANDVIWIKVSAACSSTNTVVLDPNLSEVIAGQAGGTELTITTPFVELRLVYNTTLGWVI